jgi:cytochrome c-type biogenesis protein
VESNVSILTAFIAGILSFLSPCVLPLLSSYLVFISGSTGSAGTGNSAGGGLAVVDVRQHKKRRSYVSRQQVKIIIYTLFFILGFTLVFSMLGIVLYSAFFFLSGFYKILNIAAGLIVVVLGVNIIHNFIPFFKYDDSGERCETCAPENSVLAKGGTSILRPENRPKGFLGPLLVGMAFGAGWTPCVGALLGSVLLMASQSETMARSVVCLAVYSAGLGVPFLVTSFFWGRILEFGGRYSRFLPVIKWISGLFLIAIGVLMALGKFITLNIMLQKGGFALAQWTQTGSPAVRLLPAAFFFLIALLPAAIRLLKTRKVPGVWGFAYMAVFIGLGSANAAGSLNSAAILASWFSYTGG